MKKLLPFILLVAGCSKSNDPSPLIEQKVTSINFSQTKIGVKQLIAISAKMNDTAGVRYTWSIKNIAGNNQPIIGSGSDINWLPNTTGRYTISVTTASNYISSYDTVVNVENCDFRWAFWGDSAATIAINELYNKSSLASVSADRSLFSVKMDNDYGILHTGDGIGYQFKDGRLIGGALIFIRPEHYYEFGTGGYPSFEQVYLDLYGKFDNPTNKKDTTIWANTAIAQYYKQRNMFATALLNGLAERRVTWENEVTNFGLFLNKSGGSVTFGAYYSKK